MMTATSIDEQGKPMGTVYADVTLTNMFSGRSVNVRTMVDTGAIHMVVPAAVATELGFDLEEVSVSYVTVADGRRVRCPQIAPVEIRFQDRTCPSSLVVLGDECLMGVVPLELMDLVVDPVQERVVPNPKHPDGPVFRV
jgi:clan AA aspartic protease